MTTYSKCLFSVTSSTSPVDVYTPPANTVSVLRDLEVTNQSGAADTINIFIQAIPGFAAAFIAKYVDSTAGQWHHWEGRVVIPTSSSIMLYSGAAGWTVLGSGYELVG